MEKPLGLRSIFITLVTALLVITTHGQSRGAKLRCDAGNYEVGDSCVPCAKPPPELSMIYSIYCGGVCTKGNWGRFCDIGCNSGCFNNFCNRWTGHCIHGCKGRLGGCTESLYGAYCNNTCSSHCINVHCDVVMDTKIVVCTEGCEEGWHGPYCQERTEGTSQMTIIVLTVLLCILVVCLILVVLRKRISRCHSYNKRSQWYLFPVNNSAIYSAQTSVTYSTQTSTTPVPTGSRDQRTGTTCMTRNDDGCIDGDSLYGYEVVGETDDVAVHQPISDQYSQDETYMAIPDSHFA